MTKSLEQQLEEAQERAGKIRLRLNERNARQKKDIVLAFGNYCIKHLGLDFKGPEELLQKIKENIQRNDLSSHGIYEGFLKSLDPKKCIRLFDVPNPLEEMQEERETETIPISNIEEQERETETIPISNIEEQERETETIPISNIEEQERETETIPKSNIENEIQQTGNASGETSQKNQTLFNPDNPRGDVTESLATDRQQDISQDGE